MIICNPQNTSCLKIKFFISHIIFYNKNSKRKNEFKTEISTDSNKLMSYTNLMQEIVNLQQKIDNFFSEKE